MLNKAWKNVIAKRIRSKPRQVKHQRWLMLGRESLILLAQARRAALGRLASRRPRAYRVFQRCLESRGPELVGGGGGGGGFLAAAHPVLEWKQEGVLCVYDLFIRSTGN
jgi:hypothetical protein